MQTLLTAVADMWLAPHAQAAALKVMTDQHGGDWHYVYACTKRRAL
jgi:hypothetical protein